MMSAEEDRKGDSGSDDGKRRSCRFPVTGAGLHKLIHRPQQGAGAPSGGDFFARVVGDSMVDADVNEGDVLVVDKSIEPKEVTWPSVSSTGSLP